MQPPVLLPGRNVPAKTKGLRTKRPQPKPMVFPLMGPLRAGHSHVCVGAAKLTERSPALRPAANPMTGDPQENTLPDSAPHNVSSFPACAERNRITIAYFIIIIPPGYSQYSTGAGQSQIPIRH